MQKVKFLLVVLSGILLSVFGSASQAVNPDQSTGYTPASVQGEQTSWQWLTPLPQGNTLYGICTVDSTHFFAVGELGTILSTTNAGRTWSVVCRAASVSSELWGVSFVDRSTGTAVGRDGTILRTTDAGQSWRKQRSWSSSWLQSVSFPTRDTGVAVGLGEDGLNVLRTTDGGGVWSHYVNLASSLCWYSGVSFTDGMTGTIVTGKDIFRTTDGCETWSKYSIGIDSILIAVAFYDRNLGIAVGNPGVILCTTDGGAHWAPKVSGTREYLFDVSFGSASSVCAVGSSGVILHSSDGGSTWVRQNNNSTGYLYGVALCGESGGFAVGLDGTILSTTNGGILWESQLRKTVASLEDVCFSTPSLGLATGNKGNLLFTSDGGLSWIQCDHPFSGKVYLISVAFATPSIAVAVGENGSIERTVNGGLSWDSLPHMTEGQLRRVRFVDSSFGVILGGYSLYYTSDGGEHWTGRTSPGLAISALHFLDRDTGIAAGENGIMRTTDGGMSWTTTWSNDDYYAHADFTSLAFADARRGCAVGGIGSYGDYHDHILFTTDAGSTWNRHYPWFSPYGTHYGLNDAIFTDEMTGFIVGDHGTILGSSDGGYSWKKTQLPTLKDLNLLTEARTENGGTLYAIGDGGTVFCSAISPLPGRTWVWTGPVDSSWSNPSNWLPSGLPLPGDSVVIPPAPHSPIVDSLRQQIVIGSLNILSGGKLTITDALSRFVVLGDVMIHGTFEIRPPAVATIIVGGNWTIQRGGFEERYASLQIRKADAGSDQGFIPYHSTVLFSGRGEMEGDFYNIVFDSASAMKSHGNITVANQCTAIGDVSLQSTDTLFVTDPSPVALIGSGKFLRGTVRRMIVQHSLEPYGFESSRTSVQFADSGLYPTSISVSTYPDTGITVSLEEWKVIPSFVDTFLNIVTAGNVTHFSTWAIGVPRPRAVAKTVEDASSGARILDTVKTVRRLYAVAAEGGTSYLAQLSLHYEQSELPQGVPEDSLRLLCSTAIDAVKQVQNALPKRLVLHQNYPNPFNPRTVIRFELPGESFVTLRVINLLGQEVATLVDEKRTAGEYDVRFDASGLSSGVYFYRMQAGGFVETKKLLLMR